MDVVLHIVSTQQFLVVSHPQSDTAGEEEDDDGRGDEGPDYTAHTGQALDTEQIEAPAVQETVVLHVALQVVLPGHEADSQHAPEPAHPVYSAGTDGVIHPAVDQEAGGEDDQEAAQGSRDDGRQVGQDDLNSQHSLLTLTARGTYTAGHDTDQTTQDPVTSQHHVRLPSLGDETVGQTHQAATEGGQDGGDCSLDGQDPSLPTDPKG